MHRFRITLLKLHSSISVPFISESPQGSVPSLKLQDKNIPKAQAILTVDMTGRHMSSESAPDFEFWIELSSFARLLASTSYYPADLNPTEAEVDNIGI